MTKSKEGKINKEYQYKLKVIGAMDLYGLNRETAEQLSKDVEDLLAIEREKTVKEREKETLNKLRRWLKGRKICIHDKDLVRNWINSQQLKP